jgi:hypothetical protein
LFIIHLSRLRSFCSTTESEALHACQLSTGLLSLPRKPFRQPASFSHAAPGAGVIGHPSLRVPQPAPIMDSSGAGCGDDTLLHQP